MDSSPTQEPVSLDQEELAPESYSVPATFTTKDMAGIIIALVALLVIGYAGYVWLNPDLSWSKMFPGAGPASEQQAADGVTDSGAKSLPQPGAVADSAPASQSGTDSAGSPAPADEAADTSCAQCGMDASRSQSHVLVHWVSGAAGHFDSWDCVFNYAKDQGLAIQSAEVSQFSAGEDASGMLDAIQSWYLYDTKEKVPGSMPPYVAAYPDRAAAQAAHQAMGGEVLDFAGLKDKWK